MFTSTKTVAAYKVILGAHNITGMGVGTNAVRRSVSKIIIHESYSANSKAFDIGLIKLDVNRCYSKIFNHF